MKKILGILGLLIVIVLFTAIQNPDFLSPYNLQNVVQRTSLFGILSIGVAFVIITGGIDLSIGSIVGLSAVLLPWLLSAHGFGAPAALGIVFAVVLGIGLLHGLLITKLRLQPFIVTLCGLLFYRGVARSLVEDQTQGFGAGFDTLKLFVGEAFSIGGFGVPVPLLIMIGIAILAGVLLNYTIYGRYLLALGRNEEAARFSGIHTDRMIALAYIISAMLAGVGGVLFALEVNSVQPSSFGNFYELYAIAAAVLGGCSLRGGEGSIIGVVIGAAVMRVLYNAINILGIPTQLEFAIIGMVILLGVIADELVKRYAARRRAIRQAAIEAPA